MTNSIKNIKSFPYGGDPGREVLLPVAGGSHIFEGTMVAQLASTNMLVPGSTASSGPAIGVATHEVDATNSSDSDKRCKVRFGTVFEYTNGTNTDACSETTPLFSVVYMGDDHTIFDNDGGATLKPAGRFMGMTDDGKVKVFVGMSNLGDALADASDVAIADAGTFTAQTTVEGSLQEIYQHLLSASTSIPISLMSFREATSGADVGDAAANGGILASDTTPILRGDANKSQEIAWAAGNADALACQITLPTDFDGTANATLDLFVYTDNAGGGGIDAATFTVESSWDGGATVSDTATDGSPATSIHKITATIAAADIPDTASIVSLLLTPAAHAADPTQLVGARLNYKRKLLTS